MGYFNYFIKCIIRNIAYKLCKPKVFLTVLLCVLVLVFCFKNYGYCADSTVMVEGTVVTQGNEYDGDGDVNQYDNMFLSVRNLQENYQNEFITKMYLMYQRKPTETKNFIAYIMDYWMNQPHYSTKGIIVRPQYEHEGIQYLISFYFEGDVNSDNADNPYSYAPVEGDGSLYFTYVPHISTKTFNCYYATNETFGYPVFESTDIIPVPYLNVTVSAWRQMFIDFGLINTETDNDIVSRLDELLDKSNSENQQIINKLEEQNQLQQEQNDFLQQESSNDDVSVDGFNSVDSNDITSAGLTGVFNNIYNSVTNWSSKDINLPIPYTNKSIVIPASYTENMLNRSGAGWIITFVSSIYYFIVARFIIYSITSIINSIKSGSILETDSKNNITTDML